QDSTTKRRFRAMLAKTGRTKGLSPDEMQAVAEGQNIDIESVKEVTMNDALCKSAYRGKKDAQKAMRDNKALARDIRRCLGWGIVAAAVFLACSSEALAHICGA
ncbi:MAG: hypothetical protein GY906_25855, partial [bacterium]|nr:hypothetical protein [bacterium]